MMQACRFPFVVTPVLLAVVATACQAAVVIDITEQGGNVVATASGTLNLSGLSTGGSGTQPAFMSPSTGILMLGSPSGNSFDVYTGLLTPPNNGVFGTGGSTITSTHSGDFLGLIGVNSSLRVPLGYVSGTAISSTTTWNSTTLATLGVTQGSYVWSWGSGGTADSVTLNAVPEPATWAVASLCLASGGLALRRRARRSSAKAA